MTVIEPQRTSIETPGQIKKYSGGIRLWHWLNALVITGSLLTVLTNSTLLKTRHNAAFIKDELKNAGAAITDEQARAAAHGLSDKIWELHTYLGFILVALLSFRLIVEFFQFADQKFIRTIKTAYRKYVILKQDRELAKHEFWVKTLYAIFYIMLFIMASTGLCLVFEDDVPWLRSIHAFREIHAFTMYLIIAFIIVHIAGVILAERKDGKGIVSDMINGG